MTMTNPAGVMPGDVQINGEWFIRSFVNELEEGDVNSFGERIVKVVRLNDDRTNVYTSNDVMYAFGDAHSTMLVKAVEGRVDIYV